MEVLLTPVFYKGLGECCSVILHAGCCVSCWLLHFPHSLLDRATQEEQCVLGTAGFSVLEKLGVSVKHTNALVVTWGTSS